MRAVDLAGVLSAESVDRQTFEMAGELLLRLGDGRFGPSDYSRSSDAVRAYLRLADLQAESLSDLLAVQAISDLVEDRERDWNDAAATGWTEGVRMEIAERCHAILERPEWDERARQALQSDDDTTFHEGDEVARSRGIRTIDYHVARLMTADDEREHAALRDVPGDVFTSWQAIAEQWTEEDLDDLLQLAERTLEPERIATGPADDLLFGPQFARDLCVCAIVGGLEQHPGSGWLFVRSALRSGSPRTRLQAVTTLQAWPHNTWPADAEQALLALRGDEPKDNIRAKINSALRK
jgi:hypothetical protein